MENESPAQGKTEEVLQEIELYPGKMPPRHNAARRFTKARPRGRSVD